MAYSRTPEIVMAPIKKTLFFITLEEVTLEGKRRVNGAFPIVRCFFYGVTNGVDVEFG